MYCYDDLSIFIKVVECQSFSLAAKLLQVSQPTIKRHIQHLELSLGNDLVLSNVNGIKITNFGNEVYAKWKEKEYELEQMLESLKPLTTQIEGDLKVTLPNSLSHYLITPNLPQFMQRHPRLKLTLDFNQNEPNLLSSEYNIALSTIFPSQQSLVVRTIFNSKCGLYCTRKYADLHGLPQHPSQLLNKHQIAYLNLGCLDASDSVKFKHKINQGEIAIPKQNALSLNSIDNILILLQTNDYIVGLEEYEYLTKYKYQDLIPVLPEYSYQDLKYFLVLPSRNKDSKTTTFCNFLTECIDQFSLNWIKPHEMANS